MTSQKKQRMRRVRLTPDALARLKAGLHERWRQEPQLGRLTREIQADLLGASVPTADRIMKNRGVDRMTLMLAFEKLGLEWQDSSCEYVVDGEASHLAVECERPLDSEPRGKRPRVVTLVAVLFVAILVALARPAYDELVSLRGTWAEHRRIYDFNQALLIGTNAFHAGDYRLARVQIARAVALARTLQSVNKLSFALRMAGDLAGAEGSFQEGKQFYAEALHLRESTNDEKYIPAILEALGDLETRSGDLVSANVDLKRSLSGYERLKDAVGVAMAQRDLGSVAMLEGKLGAARQWLTSALAKIDGLGKADLETDIRGRMALVLRDEGKYGEARGAFRKCLAYWERRRHPRWIAQTQLYLATVEIRESRWSEAAKMLTPSLKGFEAVGDRAGAAECRRRLAGLTNAGEGVVSSR